MVIKENGRNDSRIHLCEGLHSVNGKFFVFTQHTSYKSMPPKFVLCMSTGFYSAHGLSLVLNITPKKGTHTQLSLSFPSLFLDELEHTASLKQVQPTMHS